MSLDPLPQRLSRSRSRQIRDGIYGAIALVLLGLAVFGAVAAGALLVNKPLGAVAGDPNTGSLQAAYATATAVVADSEHMAGAKAAQFLKEARTEAAKIIAEAKHHHPQATPTPTPARTAAHPVVTPTTAALPTPTPTIPGAPNLNNVPASWVIVVFDVNPEAGSLNIVNRTSNTLSGTVVITYFGRAGHTAGIRRAPFTDIAGRTVEALSMGISPRQWSSYHLRVVTIT